MFERRDGPAAPGTHAPDFITPLAYASLAIPVLFLVVAGFWIALRFGSSNLNPADMDMHSPEDEEDDGEDEEQQAERNHGDEKEGSGGARADRRRMQRTGADGTMQPLLEDDDEDEDDGLEAHDEKAGIDAAHRSASSDGTADSLRKRSSFDHGASDANDVAAAGGTQQRPAPQKTTRWKIQPGFSSTEPSLRKSQR
ncbi:hypothetical protein OC835_002800 [Tilletia horrida]|nr:hypothetical protein OC835_002800 [Tilletia horrida]